MRRLVLMLFISFNLLAPVQAVNPDEVLADPALEQRARDLSAKLRCLVCQNQSIDDSDAQLAKDLRVLVRERLSAGDDDEAVLDFIVARYGEFVLLQPRFGAHTLFLWMSPLLAFGLALWAVFALKNRTSKETVASAVLTSEEEAALNELLDKQGR